MTTKYHKIIDQIEKTRSKNNTNWMDVLRLAFKYDPKKAAQIMLTVHTEGRAVCGIFSKDVAETKTQQVNQYSKDNHNPLLCKTEKAN